jgi:hypothetical protein
VHIAWGQQIQYAVIPQCDGSLPGLHPLAIIIQQSNKKAIDFWDTNFLSQIFFVNTQGHNPLSILRYLHNAMLATMVWSLASSSHLPVPAITTDRISRLAIHRKRSTQLKTSPTAHLQQHSPSWVASRSDSAAAVALTSTGGAATAVAAATVLLAARVCNKQTVQSDYVRLNCLVQSERRIGSFEVNCSDCLN